MNNANKKDAGDNNSRVLFICMKSDDRTEFIPLLPLRR